jgi:hypothetical protein
MDRRYGLRGTIVPTDPWRGHHESFPKGHFTIEINDGVLEIGFDEEDLAVQARALIDQYCAVKAFEMGARYAIDLNQSWEQHPGGAKSIAVTHALWHSCTGLAIERARCSGARCDS